MGYNISTNMSLPIPAVGNEPGPLYATDVNNCLTLVDQHDHSPGYGVMISPNGLNINTDLTIQNNNLTVIRSLRFNTQGSPLALVTDLDCLYESGVDLYYNDALGNQIRITQSGGVVGTPGSITNLTPPATASYSSLSKTFVWQSGVNTPANLDAASIVLRNLVASSNGLTLQPPSAMASDYEITLPTLPVATSFVRIDPTGIMAADVTPDNVTIQINGSNQLAVITTTLLPPGQITMYGGTSAPTGYLLCDGTSYLRSTYPALFTAIGTAFGSADGTHFNVPDMRGRFPRGVDGAAGRDPDAAGRTAMNTGGNTGNNVGSVQADAFGAHGHACVGGGLDSGGGNFNLASANTNITQNTQSAGGSETRPINAYVNYLIKT